MPDQREIALNHLQLHGPSLPIQIAKALNTNILFASAVLSELSSNKKLLVSHAAIGGSKVYYLKGQDAQLGEKLYPSLKGKEKQAYELLRDTKVLRDIELEPWQRIALRELKDSAIPLTVSLGSQAELFWKFHLLQDEEAKPYIEGYIVRETTPAPETQTIQPPSPKEIPTKQETTEAPFKQELEAERQRVEALKKDKLELEKAMQTLKEELLKELKAQEPKQTEALESKLPLPEKIPEEVLEEPLTEELQEEITQEVPEKNKISKDVQETIVEAKPKKLEGKFYTRIKEYLESNRIEILKEEMIKKEKEFDFIVRIPSPLGPLAYFIKAKDKKAINEADISLAHSEGQVKKLPCILLATGKMNKKASLLIEQRLQGQVNFKEL